MTGDGPCGELHGGFQQHTRRVTAGVADDAAFFVDVLYGSIGEACELERRGIEPERVLRGVVDDQRTVRDGAIEQCERGCRRRYRAEIGARQEHRILRMCGRISLQTFDENLGLVRCDARFGRRQIEPVQRVRAVEQVHMRIDDARNHGLAVEVDDLRVAASMPENLRVVADGGDMRAVDRHRGRPLGTRVTGINVAMDEQQVVGDGGVGNGPQRRNGTGAQ